MRGVQRQQVETVSGPEASPYQSAASSDPYARGARQDLARSGFSFEAPRRRISRRVLILALVLTAILVIALTLWLT